MKKLFLLLLCLFPLINCAKSTWLWSSDNDHSDAYGLVPYNDTIFPTSLTVYGVLKASQSVFKDVVEVYGALIADKTRFEKKIIVHGILELNYAMVKDDIEVKADTEKPIIHLRGTVVYGDVIFKSRGGTVYLYENAEVKGQVIGGRIVRI